MYNIADHAYLERRRISLAGLLAFVAGYMLHSHSNWMAFGMPFPVFTGLLYAVSVIITSTITTYLLPNLRWLVDSTAISRLALASWVVATQKIEIVSWPMTCATIVIVGAILILRIGFVFNKISEARHIPAKLLMVAEKARLGLAWIDNDLGRRGVSPKPSWASFRTSEYGSPASTRL